MTPTERAAVAAAIAALEKIKRIGWPAGPIRAMADAALASLRAVAPAPADQSDAGRDGVIEAVARSFGRNDGDTEFALEKLHHEGYEVRALASAPSETVERGEDALAHKILGDHCTCYAEAWPAKTCDTERSAVAKIIREAALPTADRDAIREALKSMRTFIDNWQLIHTTTDAKDELAKLTAALALIGEG